MCPRVPRDTVSAMRIALFAMLALVGSVPFAAKDPKPPDKIVFPAKAGDVPFDHKAHIAREKKNCAACHDRLFPMSTKEPLATAAGCRTCHKPEGRAFDAKQCKKCHPDGTAKQG